MRKLLAANFSRLWKDKTFWLCMGIMLVYSVVYMLNGCRQATLILSEYHYSIDEYYFHFAIVIGAFCALFSSMFLGTEYSDGTIRNKIVVGHTRTSIYMADFILIFVVTLLLMVVWMIGALVGIPALGVWKIGGIHLLVYLLIAVMFAAAFSGIFTFVSMVSANKALTVAVSIFNDLGQPEMVSGVEITANGMEMGEPAPNPNYVSGKMRILYEFILDFLPTGQGVQMWQLEISNPIRMLISSVFITAATTLGGIFVFKRKNLK